MKITQEDILKYATEDELDIIFEDSIPEPPVNEEDLKKKEEEKAANNILLNIHLALIDAAALLGDLSMPKEYRDKNIIDTFNNIKSRVSTITLGEREE